MDAEKTEFHLFWFVENYSYFESFRLWLSSAKFVTEGLMRTCWNLGMDAEFLANQKIAGHSVWLDRSSVDEGPEKIGIKFEIVISKAYGSTFYSGEHSFGKGGSCSIRDMHKLCVPRNTNLSSPDTVVVRCRMWRGEGCAQKVTQCTARTRALIRKISFLLKVENFSTSVIDKENTLKKIPSLSETGCNVSAFLKISKRDESIIVVIDSMDDGYRIDKKTLFLIDASGNTVQVVADGDFEEDDDDSDSEDSDDGDSDEDDDNHEENLPKLTRQFILNNEKTYLPNDELNLMCELIVWCEDCISDETLHDIPMATYLAKYTKVHFESEDNVAKQSAIGPIESENGKVIESDHLQSEEVLKERRNSTDNIAMPPVEWNQIKVSSVQKETNNDVVKLSSSPSVTDDLAALYREQLLTDVELKTPTKSFPAHKLVLCTRSSVFSSMLTDNTQSIEVEDMEDETVPQLLLFLYTNSLEDLQWESAIQLYRAGGKYVIETLREFCLVYLLNNLSTSYAIQLLLLAETLGDAKLKNSVNRFILEHEEEVFSSDEWRVLSKTNPSLIVETMLLKYEREK